MPIWASGSGTRSARIRDPMRNGAGSCNRRRIGRANTLREEAMPDERPKYGAALRVVAALMFPVFLALVVLYFPLTGLPEQPWRIAPVIGAALGATYCAMFAATGRKPKWP